MSEIWLPLPGFEHGYMVSDLGRVQSLFTGRIRKQQVDHYGYAYVQLSKKGELTRVFVHQAVTRAFLGKCPPGKFPNHKDGAKTNNRLDNFEFLTRKGNAKHAAALGLYATGARNRNTKLTDAQVREIKAKYVPYSRTAGTTALARRFCVHPQTVVKIVRKRTWRGVGRLRRGSRR